MKLWPLILMLAAGCATTQVQMPAPIVRTMTLQSVIAPPTAPPMLRLSWADDPQVNAWVVVCANDLNGPWMPCAIVTHPAYNAPMTKTRQYFNYCISQDYGSWWPLN